MLLKIIYIPLFRTNNKRKMEEKYKAIAQIAQLLRETTVKKMVVPSYVEGGLKENGISGYYPEELIPVYENSVFTPEQHEDVKRAFLKLIGEL